MSLEKTDLRELVKDLVEIGELVEEAQESRSVHAPPEVRARGKAQLPILLKCELLLSDELHRRLGGYCELAEVAIDAMEEYVADQQAHKTLADIFGPLESEEAEAKAAEALEVLEALRATGADDPALEFHKPGECIMRIPADDSEWTRPGTAVPTHKLDVERFGTGAMGTTPPAQKLDVYSLGLPKCLQGEDHDPLLWAMKEAAWASLQRLETDVLVEYLKLWVEKHADYGVENHAIWGCQGAIIRATDKLMRLKGQYFDGRTMKIVENDWLDLIGYGLIGIVIERGQWPVMALEEVLGQMQTHYGGDDAFEHVMGDMKAKMEEQSIRCRRCDDLGTGPHSCPYQRAVNGNDDPEYCTCCEDCTTRCRNDI